MENTGRLQKNLFSDYAIIEGNEKFSVGKYGEVYTNNINEL